MQQQYNNPWSWNNNNTMGNTYQKPMIPGRIITSGADMKPMDVPTDGTPAVFFQNDGSCIYVKFWNQNCELQTIRYFPDTVLSNALQEQQNQQNNSILSTNNNQNDPFRSILSRLDAIEQKLNNQIANNNSSDAKNYYGSEKEK